MKYFKHNPVLLPIKEEPEEEPARDCDPRLAEAATWPGGPPSIILKKAMALPPYPGGPPSKELRKQVNILIHSRTLIIIKSFIKSFHSVLLFLLCL